MKLYGMVRRAAYPPLLQFGFRRGEGPGGENLKGLCSLGFSPLGCRFNLEKLYSSERK